LVTLIFGAPPRVINANLVRQFVIRPASHDPDSYAIYAEYGKNDSKRIYTGELEQCESRLREIAAILDPSGHDRIDL
jgi:hypothetical protein